MAAGLHLKSISQLNAIPSDSTCLKVISVENEITRIWETLSDETIKNKGFNPLSIADTLSIEASNGTASYKLKLADIVTPFLQACIWLKAHSEGYVRYQDLTAYVPWDLANSTSNAISNGTLYVKGAAGQNALIVDGTIGIAADNISNYIADSNRRNLVVELNKEGQVRANSIVANSSLTVANILSAYTDGTTKKVNAVNLSTDKIIVNGFLSANSSSTTRIANISATTLTAVGQTKLATNSGVSFEAANALTVNSTVHTISAIGISIQNNLIVDNNLTVTNKLTARSYKDEDTNIIHETLIDKLSCNNAEIKTSLLAKNLTANSSGVAAANLIINDVLTANKTDHVKAEILSTGNLTANSLNASSLTADTLTASNKLTVDADDGVQINDLSVKNALTVNNENLVANSSGVAAKSLTVDTNKLVANNSGVAATSLTVDTNKLVANSSGVAATSLTVNTNTLIANSDGVKTAQLTANNKLTVDNSDVKAPSLSSTTLTVNVDKLIANGSGVVAASLTVNTDTLIANSSGVAAASLTVDTNKLVANNSGVRAISLTATDALTANSDGVKTAQLTANNKLTVDNSDVKAPSLSSTTLTVNNEKLVADNNGVTASKLIVTDILTASSTTVEANSLKITSLTAGIEGASQNLVVHQMEPIHISKLQADNLTATGSETSPGIAHLTAAAACWS